VRRTIFWVAAALEISVFANVQSVPERDLPITAAPITGLSHVQLLVSDIRASASWYTKALGLEPYVEDFEIGYVALRHRGAKVVIVLTIGDGGQMAGTGSGYLDHLAFAVPDETALRSWAERLTTAGIDHPEIVLEGGNPSLQLRDPDGISIELVAPGPRTTRPNP
jgi:glyoxylase I family protein